MSRYRLAATALFSAALLAGCGANADKPPAAQTKPDEVAAERAKLPPADRALVEAQEWCVVNTDERLGSMGPPMKLDIRGQTVLICCKGCKRKAEADPDKTLAKAEELKTKAKAEREAKK
ncbi:MAG: hypothetical protein C0501_25165 [Isosphaera sp.]|nr:hypothetical protein [Isosphaera sp.]